MRFNNNTLTSSCLFFVLLHVTLQKAWCLVECSNDEKCVEALREGSFCLNDTGFCSNPFAAGGCLSNRLSNWTKIRVCNSQDPPSAIERGLCRQSPLNYSEVRIQSQNWESALFVTWVMQVILSELLDVPTSIETSFYELRTNLYDLHSSLSYGYSNDVEAMERAAQTHDCVPLTTNLKDYQSCAHVISETWGSHRWAPKLEAAGIIEPTQSMGELGHEGWYIPLFTAKQDASLLHFSGLEGEANREKLAKTFLTPLSWGDYCKYVSPDNCTTPGPVAARAPPSPSDSSKFFEKGIYTGHFQAEEQNNCTANPTTCRGHFVDFPCGWSSYVEPTLYHMNIALESQKYEYTAMQEIWRAANATKSHVMMLYPNPDALVPEFAHSEAAFERVALIPPTQHCAMNRREDRLRCTGNLTERLGNVDGICDEPVEALKRVVSTALFQITNGPHIPEAMRSPAYMSIKDFTISDLQVLEMFTYWHSRSLATDKRNFDIRDAACEWMSDNLDFLQSFVPPGFPRVIQPKNEVFADHPILVFALCFGILSFVCSLVSSGVTYARRETPAMTRVQLPFLFLLLAGLLLVSAGSILASLPPNDINCIAAAWLTNFGYSIELVPLVVRSAALNHIMGAGRRMRRSLLKQESMYRSVALISALVLAALAVWTAVDPPLRATEYKLIAEDTTTSSSGGEGSVIEEEYHCKSESAIWRIVGIAWQLLLLLIAGVLAFQNRNYRNDLTDVRTLAIMIYSHLVFVGLRGVTYLVERSVGAAALHPYQSLLYSGDVVVTLIIYFLPKFFAEKQRNSGLARTSWGGSSHIFASNQLFVPSSAPNVSASSGDQTTLSDFVLENGVEVCRLCRKAK